ncbi:MAG: tetratricopeptide repeat protein [Pseudarcicella sp.]|jgi:tetratricopeptide (TPR) repeat protein|nr:tetratricopeptide repeat protein [Pseudarcicella sp.]MBP6409932.1 tetratricopeptide repeat protein [Pseudarcicella sp.]
MKFNFKIYFLILSILFCENILAQKKKKVEVISATKNQENEAQFTEALKWYLTEDYAKSIAEFEKLNIAIPNSAPVSFQLANCYYKINNLKNALTHAENAVTFSSKSTPDYEVFLAELYVENQQYDNAVDIYKSLISRNPEKIEYLVELSKVYLTAAKYEDALKTLQETEKNIGLNENITVQKQLVLIKLGKIEEALKEGEKLVFSEPQEISYKINQAQLMISNRRYDEATQYIKNILENNPDKISLHLLLAQIYQETNKTDLFNTELEYIIKDDNVDFSTKTNLLMSYVLTQKDNNAKEKAFQMVEIMSQQKHTDPRINALYGDMLIAKKKTKEARNQYVKAIKSQKSMNEVWSRIIQLDFELGELDSALVHTEEAIELFPNQALFWYQNGTAYYLKKNNHKAIESFEEAARLAPENSELSQYINAQLGDSYNAIGKHEQSDQAYESVLKANPNNEHVLNNYSYFLSLRKSKMDLALQMASKLVDKNPTNGTYLDTYAWILYISKDYSKAKNYIEKALADSSKTNNGTIIEHYGDILFQLGEKDNAFQQWKRASELKGSSHNIKLKIAEKRLIE